MAIVGGIIAIVIGIFLFFFAVGLIIMIFKGIFYLIAAILRGLLYLVKPAIGIGFLIGILYLFGFSGLILLGVAILLIYIIKAVTQEPLEKQVKKIFLKYEMSTISDLVEQLKGAHTYQEVREVIQQLIWDGKLEEIDFGNKEEVYKWTENRSYAKGVVRKTITLD